MEVKLLKHKFLNKKAPKTVIFNASCPFKTKDNSYTFPCRRRSKPNANIPDAISTTDEGSGTGKAEVSLIESLLPAPTLPENS